MKLVKSATALILGASILTTTAITPISNAQAKTSFKVTLEGALVNALSNTFVKGYKSYLGILYKDGQPFTGIYKQNYYKKGLKSTGTYKGAYYVKGVKKVTTGTYSGAYYVKGKKVVDTGLYKEKFYKNGILNVGLALFNDKYYYNADLANDTYIDNGVEKAFENGVIVGPKVKSVEAANAKQIKITFNRSVDATTVIGEANALKNIKVTKVGETATTGLTAEVSGDKRSIIITAGSNSNFSGSYVVEISDKVKAVSGDAFASSSQIVKVDDKIAPTYVNFTKENASTFVFNFSEPINDKGTIVFKKSDGTTIQVPDDQITVQGSSIKVVFPSTVEAGKDIFVSFTGLTDFASNILATPFSVTVQKGAKDGVAPEVKSITPINAKKFEITFSEPVQEFDKGDVTIAGSNTAIKSITPNKTDATKYIVELNTATSGLVNISIAGSYADLSGEAGKAFNQIVSFVVDTIKPTVTAGISIDTDEKQVLTLTSSEETTFVGTGIITLPAKAVNNYITTPGNIKFASSDLIPVSGSSTQYTIPLSKVQFNDKPLVENTTYTVDLIANLFADTADNKNDAKSAAFSFTRAIDKDNSKPTLTDIKVTVIDNDTFTVDFGTAIALDNSTVVNKANYYVAGATVDNVTLDANGVATVKLVPGSNNYSGNRSIKITGIKAKNGNVMDDFVTIKSINENVKPTLSSAKVANIVKATATDPGSTTVALTFSENVKVDQNTTYKVNVGGKELIGTVASVSQTATSSKVITLTINKELSATDFQGGITLTSDNYHILDEANNKADLSTSGITVTL